LPALSVGFLRTISAKSRCFLQGQKSVSFFLLVGLQLTSSARARFLTVLGDKLGVRTVLHGLADDRGITVREAARQSS
jgi:hypothetical protein